MERILGSTGSLISFSNGHEIKEDAQMHFRIWHMLAFFAFTKFPISKIHTSYKKTAVRFPANCCFPLIYVTVFILEKTCHFSTQPVLNHGKAEKTYM